MDCPNPKRSAAAAPGLPDDAIVEILARAPARTIQRFKCVSKPWRDLIADPLHRKRLLQTLEGFFCSDLEIHDDGGAAALIRHVHGHFITLPGRSVPPVDPSFSFLTKLPGNEHIRILDSCNGLLLFGHDGDWGINVTLGYIVCNPATEQWVVVPSAGCPSPEPPTEAPTYMIFDPAVSPHFHLVHVWQERFLGEVEVRTYSSETGVWINSTSERSRWQEGGGWKQWVNGGFGFASLLGSAFVNGMLHFIARPSPEGVYLIVAVDREGKTCRIIHWPDKPGRIALFVGQSQGRMYCVSGHRDREGNSYQWTGLSIWVLEDYDTEEWVLKHSVCFLKLFGRMSCRNSFEYNVLAIHPDCNWVFLVQHFNRKLIAYDMDSKEVHALCTLEHKYGFFTPYVPYFSESSVLANKL